MTTQEPIPYRPLGMIATMLEGLGFQPTHFHEDLVFVEHNAFLVQMGEEGKDLHVWFNVDCESGKTGDIMDAFQSQAEVFDFNIQQSGTYKMVANSENETLQIEFIA